MESFIPSVWAYRHGAATLRIKKFSSLFFKLRSLRNRLNTNPIKPEDSSSPFRLHIFFLRSDCKTLEAGLNSSFEDNARWAWSPRSEKSPGGEALPVWSLHLLSMYAWVSTEKHVLYLYPISAHAILFFHRFTFYEPATSSTCFGMCESGSGSGLTVLHSCCPLLCRRGWGSDAGNKLTSTSRMCNP